MHEATIVWPERGRGHAWLGAAGKLVRAHPYTALVLAVGLAVRVLLVPLTHGQDFVVWDLASRYTLAGVNVYAHHPPYPGGPYAYVPLFLYVELPFQWLALHAALPFTILGKLPIMAGDLLAAALIAAYLARHGRRDDVVALGTALYFLNPLVLYNGAFYGRFDTVCVALLLLALRAYNLQGHAPRGHVPGEGARGWMFPLLYGLAVAAKTYPVFILPWLLRWGRGERGSPPSGRGRIVAGLAAVLGTLSLPYLVSSPIPFFNDIVRYDAGKLPGNLSWQTVLLPILPPDAVLLVGYVLLALFVVALWVVTRLDLMTYCTVAILLFLVLSKVVIEQYFLWPLPFLIIAAIERRSWAAGALLLLLSATGTLVNPFVHPFGQQNTPIAIGVALCIALYVLTRVMSYEL